MATGIFRKTPWKGPPRPKWRPQYAGVAPPGDKPPPARARSRQLLFRRKKIWRASQLERLVAPIIAPVISPVIKRKVTPVWARWPKKRVTPLLLRPKNHPAFYLISQLALACRMGAAAQARGTLTMTTPPAPPP